MVRPPPRRRPTRKAHRAAHQTVLPDTSRGTVTFARARPAHSGTRPVLSGESGGYYFVEQAPIINAYLEKLVSVDDNNDIAVTSAVLSQISLADAARIKEALFRFFAVAAAQAAAANPAPKL